ncbi:MAG: alpha/beta fold hydrolase [Verrucomicrobiota bacterium]|jgi:triacylglycerol lipase
MNVVLVHGFLNRGGIMRGLAHHLTSAGHTCIVPSLKPCDARCGLPNLANQLGRFINESLSDGSRFAIVGFSMGALVARYYLQELGGCQRTDAFFSICGPHSGTLTAYMYPSEGVYQMRPNSKFLVRLNQTADHLAGISITCYWTPFDLMICPGESAKWPRSEHVRIPALLHSLVVFDRRLYRDIAQRLSATEPNKSPQPTATAP